MKKSIIVGIFIILPLWSYGRTLTIGIPQFDPPYVMQLDSGHYDGFNIAMMDYICQKIKATCNYAVFHRNEIIDAVADGKVDMATTDMAITEEWPAKISFSVPYLVQVTQIITLKKSGKFTVEDLNNKIIGISDEILYSHIDKLRIQNPDVRMYFQDDDLVEALYSGDIHFALIDKDSAGYWVSNSKNKLKYYGTPTVLESSLGIAINSNDPGLKKEINAAIYNYLDSQDFIEDYNKYLLYFGS